MTSLFAESNKKKNTDFQEVQDTVSRLAAHKGVTAVLILNANGDILTQSTNTTTTTTSSSSSGMIGNPKLLKKTLDIASLYIQSIPKDNDTTNISRLSRFNIRSGITKPLIKGMSLGIVAAFLFI